jgi:hypothetical protein
MKIVATAILAGLFSAAGFGQQYPAPLTPLPAVPLPAGIVVEFSADGADIVGDVAKYIAAAKHEVLVSEYLVTDIRVLEALAEACQRNRFVAVVLDRSPAVRNYDTPRYLRSQGIPVVLAPRGADGHRWHNERFLVIDRELVITTTCDLTLAAARNTESMRVDREVAIMTRYFNAWIAEAGRGTRLQ